MSRKFAFLIVCLLSIGFIACEDSNPTRPSSTDDDETTSTATTITNIINIGGDDNGGGKGTDPDPEPDEPQNRPPVLVVPGTQTNDVGDNAAVNILATDPDGDSLSITYDPQSAPRNCSITGTGPNSATISCVISSSSAADSPFTVRVGADDGRGGVAVGFFIWIINTPDV